MDLRFAAGAAVVLFRLRHGTICGISPPPQGLADRAVLRAAVVRDPVGCGAVLAPIGRLVDRWIGDGPLSPGDWIIRHGLLYMVLIFTAEYLSGAFLQGLGMCPWDYTGYQTSVNGLIRLDFAPLWFATGLLFEQISKFPKKRCE